jgi:hypothetical protein
MPAPEWRRDFRVGRANSVKARARDSGDLRSALNGVCARATLPLCFDFTNQLSALVSPENALTSSQSLHYAETTESSPCSLFVGRTVIFTS